MRCITPSQASDSSEIFGDSGGHLYYHDWAVSVDDSTAILAMAESVLLAVQSLPGRGQWRDGITRLVPGRG